MKIRAMLAAMLVLAAAPLAAQGTISPGMTAEQVRSAFGTPATTRESGDWTYWYYHNGCPVRCGSDDVVFFREGRVVAAVLRTSARRFSGPRAGDALEGTAEVRREDAGPEAERPMIVRGRSREPVRVGGVRVDGEEMVEEAADSGGTIIIRRDENDRGGARPLPPGVVRGGVAPDTIAQPATQVDDERRARESRVEPNTIRPQVSPDTINKDRRTREKAVTPRVVPRP